jgi:flagellar basal body rod protein FlgG
MRLLDGENRPIRVADGPVAVTQEGDVFVDGILQGRLGLRDLAPGATVEKLGDGYFRASAPGTQSTARIRQSTREGSTADQVGTMVDMMTVNRHHEATVAALRLLDGMFESAATSVGRVNGP